MNLLFHIRTHPNWNIFVWNRNERKVWVCVFRFLCHGFIEVRV